jgi:hypothetical protein
MTNRLAALSLVLLTVSIAACSTLPEQNDDIDATLDGRLDTFCFINNSPTNEDRIKRAKLVLAAVAGYGYRSVQHYSRLSDIRTDSDRIVAGINDAYLKIDLTAQQSTSALFPIYRADMIVELSEAAGAAIAPTLRAAKRSIAAATVSERLGTARSALAGILEDQLYMSAYKRACDDFEQMTDAEVTRRIKDRCQALVDLSRLTGGGAVACVMR